MLREAIRESGISLGELAGRTGVDTGGLSRFMNEKGGMTLSSFEALAPGLGLRW